MSTVTPPPKNHLKPKIKIKKIELRILPKEVKSSIMAIYLVNTSPPESKEYVAGVRVGVASSWVVEGAAGWAL